MSDLMQGGAIRLTGTVIKDEYIWPEDTGFFSSRMVIDALAGVTGDVTLIVNSDGGMPAEGEAIRAALEAHPGKVTVKVTGNAHSAASLMIMSADHIEMSAGSLMLIHDPSMGAHGNPAALAASAAELDVMANAYAGVYAARAGITKDEARGIMRAETMLTAEAAVEAGFADAVTAQPVAALGDPDMSRAAALVAAGAAMQRAREAQMKFEANAEAGLDGGESQETGQEANTAKQEVDTMSNENSNAPANTPAATPAATPATMQAPAQAPVMSVEAALSAERERVAGIEESAAAFPSAVSRETVMQLIADGTSVADANRKFIAMHAAAGAPRTQPARIVTDERDTRRIGMTAAAVAQMLGEATPADERAAPYMRMSLVDMAADLTGAPRARSTGERAELLMSAGHSTADFPLILSNAFNTVIERTYEIAEPTFTAFSREKTFNDFRAHDIVRPDNFPRLQEIAENGEIKFGTFGESKETMALASYAVGITISRQAMVNDTFNAIAEVINDASAIVPDFEESTFWAMLLSNPALSDGKGVFHADHGNVGATGAINVTNVAAGRKAMRSQKLKDGRPIRNNFPALLVVGPERETEAEQFLAPLVAADQANVNPVARSLRQVTTEQITNDAWYLMVDSSRPTHAFKHGYLDGYRAPRVRVNDPFGTQGTALTIEHDFACGAVGYMGAYKRG